ncbi:hypothetical protein V8E36_009255 [Tilletia maclaganii]
MASSSSSSRAGRQGDQPPSAPPSYAASEHSAFRKGCEKVKTTLVRHCNFIGPGIVASVAYADPGNWATDLEAGASHGYKLLFAVLLSGLFAILLQVLACRLGIVTGLDLACSSRQLILGPFGNHPSAGGGGLRPTDQAVLRRPRCEKWLRYGGLWSIYLIAEAAIVATELAELVGSAIALNLLFPKLPLWAGVLVTGADVFLILFVYRPNGGLRAFEVLIGTLVVIVLACYIVLLVRVKPDWGEAFKGYLPSATLVEHDALYIAVGILGATVMPHGLFLGSHFSTVNRLEEKDSDDEVVDRPSAASSMEELPRASVAESARGSSRREADGALGSPTSTPKTIRERTLDILVRRFPRIDASAFRPGLSRPTSSSSSVRRTDDNKKSFSRGPRIPDMDPDKPPEVSLAMVKTHLPHASIDIALSLLAFAITINSAILIVAAAATSSGEREVGSLFEAFDLLKTTVGQGAAILFAIALLGESARLMGSPWIQRSTLRARIWLTVECRNIFITTAAGQSASLTVCLAGQIISEGFIRWRTSPLTRRLLTRIIAMVPSLIVAAAVGRDGVDSLLVGSQVVLSMALPFVTAPLLIMTCRKKWMRVWEDAQGGGAPPRTTAGDARAATPAPIADGSQAGDATVHEQGRERGDASALDGTDTPAAAARATGTDADAGQLESGGKWHFFQTWWPITIVAWAVFGVICVADVFTLATL